jgi:hypothetical protein
MKRTRRENTLGKVRAGDMQIVQVKSFNVRSDLRKMKLLKWTEQTQDRHEWKKTVEKAKTLHEL